MSKDITAYQMARFRCLYRDNYTCQICGVKVGHMENTAVEDAHTHHKKPRSLGGDDVVENLVTLCRSCHEEHHAKGRGMFPDKKTVRCAWDGCQKRFKTVRSMKSHCTSAHNRRRGRGFDLEYCAECGSVFVPTEDSGPKNKYCARHDHRPFCPDLDNQRAPL